MEECVANVFTAGDIWLCNLISWEMGGKDTNLFQNQGKENILLSAHFEVQISI